MKRIPYSDPCVNGSVVPSRSSDGCAGSSIEQGVNLSLSAANRLLATLRQQHGVPSTAPQRSERTAAPQKPSPSSPLSQRLEGEKRRPLPEGESWGEGFSTFLYQNKLNHKKEAENSHTVDGWLTPLHNIIQQNEKSLTVVEEPSSLIQESSPLAPLSEREEKKIPDTVRVSPQLLAGMLREEAVVAGRVWLLARALDEMGQGWVSIETLRERLTGKESAWRICGWRRLRQILAAGSGQFWQRDERGRLWLLGQVHIAANVGVERFSRATVELPVDLLVKNVGTVRAAFFAAQHTGDAPISRATLHDITEVPERTQRHYDSVTKTQKQINWGIGGIASADAHKENLYQHGRAAFIFKDKQGQRRLARQLPNSYICPFRIVDQSKKRSNQKLQDLVNQGRRGNVRFEQRYFSDGRSFADSKADCGFVHDQKIGGRNVWISFGA